jgi:uncharacterized protein YprB with RNaseH-like and TPR domain
MIGHGGGMNPVRKSQLLTMDDRDTKLEIRHLLTKLSPHRRVAFLEWCGLNAARPARIVVDRKVDLPNTMQERVVAAYRSDRDDDVLTNDVLCNFWMLVAQWGLDAERAALVLEQYVRRGDLPPSPRPAASSPTSPLLPA